MAAVEADFPYVEAYCKTPGGQGVLAIYRRRDGMRQLAGIASIFVTIGFGHKMGQALPRTFSPAPDPTSRASCRRFD
jgi:hypothetical protein